MIKIITVTLLLLTISLSEIKVPISMIPHDGPLKAAKPPSFKLDLNNPPRQRWTQIAQYYKQAMNKLFTDVIDKLPIPRSLYVSFGLWANSQSFMKEYVQEMKGIADVLEVQWEKILLANYLYEVSTVVPTVYVHFCTSIVARTPDGTIIHGRNLDFWPWQIISQDTATVMVYRGDTYVCEWQQPVGAVFVLTGMKKDRFSITVDTRYDHSKNAIQNLLDNIFVHKYLPSAYLVRQVLEADIEYEEALDRLKNTNVAANIYYIIAGIEKGGRIEKSPVGYHLFSEIDQTSDKWYIVTTNYDEGEDPGPDQRKLPAEIRLNDIGKENISYQKLYEDVMIQYPTTNMPTIYTTMMVPKTNQSEISLWYGSVNDFDENDIENFYIKDHYARQQQESEQFTDEQIIEIGHMAAKIFSELQIQ